MSSSIVIIFIILFIIIKYAGRSFERRIRKSAYSDYLNSDEWQRKRYVVLKRDNYRCVYCGAKATQVHHKRYAKINIGKEPIDWLVSVCDECHKKRHHSLF